MSRSIRSAAALMAAATSDCSASVRPVAAMRSCVVFEDCDSYSWNHAKTISVDGVDALVGGHNMYALDYLLDDPVSDGTP